MRIVMGVSVLVRISKRQSINAVTGCRHLCLSYQSVPSVSEHNKVIIIIIPNIPRVRADSSTQRCGVTAFECGSTWGHIRSRVGLRRERLRSW